MFEGKVLLITGGTGSFGNAVLSRLLNTNVKEIRIFSRDEKKQDDQRNYYKNNKIKFYIGDVRDENSLYSALKDVDYVFHAAALKQVPSCEFYPLEAFKTNVLGTENLLNAAIARRVSKVICLSTDKAVYPINAMGISKAMMEKLAIAKSRDSVNTKICITRYGNVMGSRGSVIPLFTQQLLSSSMVTITDPDMTRFMMTLDDAVDLVFYAFENCKSGDIYVKDAPSASIDELVEAMAAYHGIGAFTKNIIGTRHGEKLFESLLTREEYASAIIHDGYYQILPDLRSLNYGTYINEGVHKISEFNDLNSHNSRRLSKDELIKLFNKVPEIFTEK